MQTSLGVLVTKLRNVNVLFQQVWIILLFFAVFSPLLIRRLWSGSFCWNRGWNIEIFSEFLEENQTNSIHSICNVLLRTFFKQIDSNKWIQFVLSFLFPGHRFQNKTKRTTIFHWTTRFILGSAVKCGNEWKSNKQNVISWSNKHFSKIKKIQTVTKYAQ